MKMIDRACGFMDVPECDSIDLPQLAPVFQSGHSRD
jgi:hypothetical protein